VGAGPAHLFAIDGLTTKDLAVIHGHLAAGGIGSIQGLVVSGDDLLQCGNVN